MPAAGAPSSPPARRTRRARHALACFRPRAPLTQGRFLPRCAVFRAAVAFVTLRAARRAKSCNFRLSGDTPRGGAKGGERAEERGRWHAVHSARLGYGGARARTEGPGRCGVCTELVSPPPVLPIQVMVLGSAAGAARGSGFQRGQGCTVLAVICTVPVRPPPPPPVSVVPTGVQALLGSCPRRRPAEAARRGSGACPCRDWLVWHRRVCSTTLFA